MLGWQRSALLAVLQPAVRTAYWWLPLHGGGCRPLQLQPLLIGWRLLHRPAMPLLALHPHPHPHPPSVSSTMVILILLAFVCSLNYAIWKVGGWAPALRGGLARSGCLPRAAVPGTDS